MLPIREFLDKDRRLQRNRGLVLNREDKENGLLTYFQQHLGNANHRPISLNWEALGYQPHDLAHLEEPFVGEQ